MVPCVLIQRKRVSGKVSLTSPWFGGQIGPVDGRHGMRVLAAIGLVTALGLTACGRNDPGPAPFLGITPGTYQGQAGQTCALLEFLGVRAFRRDGEVRGSLDPGCTGQASAVEVQVNRDVIALGDAVVMVTAVGPQSFSGTFSRGGTSQEVRFDRVAGR